MDQAVGLDYKRGSYVLFGFSNLGCFQLPILPLMQWLVKVR